MADYPHFSKSTGSSSSLSSSSFWHRKLDGLYLIFFVIHIPTILRTSLIFLLSLAPSLCTSARWTYLSNTRMLLLEISHSLTYSNPSHGTSKTRGGRLARPGHTSFFRPPFISSHFHSKLSLRNLFAFSSKIKFSHTFSQSSISSRFTLGSWSPRSYSVCASGISLSMRIGFSARRFRQLGFGSFCGWKLGIIFRLVFGLWGGCGLEVSLLEFWFFCVYDSAVYLKEGTWDFPVSPRIFQDVWYGRRMNGDSLFTLFVLFWSDVNNLGSSNFQQFLNPSFFPYFLFHPTTRKYI